MQDLSKMSNEMAQVVITLMDQGIPLEEALQEVLKPKATIIIDRIKYIQELNNVTQVRKAINSALAKRSKATNELQWRKYTEEVQVAQKRLEELKQKRAEAENPVQKAIAQGETINGVLQIVIAQLEGEVAQQIKDLQAAKGLSNKAVKGITSSMPDDTHPTIVRLLNKLGNGYLEQFRERCKAGDQRCVYLNKKLHLVMRNQRAMK